MFLLEQAHIWTTEGCAGRVTSALGMSVPGGAHACECVHMGELHVLGAMRCCRGLCSTDTSFFLMDIYTHTCVLIAIMDI